MSNTYLQDFGLLRKQANAQDVHDPMSSAGRWDDLQLDLRRPHIPQARRASMRKNRKLTVGNVTVPLPIADAELNKALGFKACTGGPKYALSNMTSDKWEHAPHDANVRWLLRRDQQAEAKMLSSNINIHQTYAELFGRLIAKMWFNNTPKARGAYERQFRFLWQYRHAFKKVLGKGGYRTRGWRKKGKML